MLQDASLYFHFPCFDGIVSAVLAADFLDSKAWSIREFYPVNYTVRSTWLSNRLKKPSAVVDFLYHPDADFWADHHSTSFLSVDVRIAFDQQQDPWKLYRSEAPSCASLLWHYVSDYIPSERYGEMVKWADIIDSARYSSVEEAIMGDTSALRIRSSLMHKADPTYGILLVRELRNKNLSEVANLPEVNSRYERVRSLTEIGLKRFKESAHLASGDIVVFQTEATKEYIFNRYTPFYFFPEARYSIGLSRSTDGMSIMAMRNPWREFPSVPLGSIFAKYGGGGHARVGAVVLSREASSRGEDILRELVGEIQTREALTEPLLLHASA